jgi:hypothetical protein
MPLDKEELAKLKPEERIKRLKEIEEESKKQIEEAEKIIQASEGQIVKEQIERNIAVPETKKIEISDLFEQPPTDLEKKAAEAKTEEPTEKQLQYMVSQAYEEVSEMDYQDLSKQDLQKIDALGERLEKVKYHTESENIANMVVATRSLISKIKKYSQQDHKW